MMHDWTGANLDLEQTPTAEPDAVSGNVSDCYICGRNFNALAKILRECVVKLEHSYVLDDKKSKRRIAYFMSVCVWCYNAHCKSPERQR